MGYPMARNLLRAGHEVALWSHSAGKARELAEAEKGRFCATPKEAAENAECIFLCVGDTAMSRELILGKDGIIEGARPGTVVSRRELLTEVWHQAYGDDQTIDVHLSWLRRKLGETAARPRYLHTLRGVGVKLEPPA